MVRLDSVPLGSDQQSWVLTSDGTTLHNGEVISRLKEKPVEGDILVSGIIIDLQCNKTVSCVCSVDVYTTSHLKQN